MGDDYGTAVEAPRPVVRVIDPPRRHRSLTGTSGLLLFTCLFLPAVKGCSEPVVPLETPPFWLPYLYGFAFAAVALARSPFAFAVGAVALRVLAWLAIVGGTAMLVLAPAVGVIELGLGLLLLGAIGWTGSSERRFAVTAITIGAVSALWFGLWCLTPGALVGVYVAFWASLGLFIGGLIWFAEIHTVREARVPPAVIHRR